MPWREVSRMDRRIEFVALAQQPGSNRRELCRRFEISAKTGYKWLARAVVEESGEWYADRSRRPHVSPQRSAAELEAGVLRLRDEYPVWGARKTGAACGMKGCWRRRCRPCTPFCCAMGG